MFYYGDLYQDVNNAEAQRWTFIVSEMGAAGWAKLQLVQIDAIEGGVLVSHVNKEEIILRRARLKVIDGVPTYLLNMPEAKKGVCVALIASPEILPLTLENVKPLVLYGNGLP